MRGFVIILVLLLVTSIGFYGTAQDTTKKVYAIRVSEPPVIDGVLDDPVWVEVPAATGFLQTEPYFGQPASQLSEVRFVYDNMALYVGAKLYDTAPDSILKEMSVRDEINNSDWFGIRIDPFNDALVSYGFAVTPSGVQLDVKNLGEEDDESWDAVWMSAVKITAEGWFVELKIPYSALRFPKNSDDKPWGVNIFRNIRRYRETSSWNPVDKKVAGINTQAGELYGINDIDPPVRLAMIPYVSGYLTRDPQHAGWGYSYKGGMDIKYGINDSYTLDMILIPDFGQVESDELVYNLTPFEVYYGEKRPFFMEGTELFDKGDVFYSRRIGDKPSGNDNVADSLEINEKVVTKPEETQLINATKITGKNRKGFATGFFNAMTANTYAKVMDTLSGNVRKILTEPFTNYNMVIAEQSLKNNSYVSLFNTNVYKPHDKFSVNVTGTDFRIINKNNTYGIGGEFIVSQKYSKTQKPEMGYSYKIEAGKISGNFTFNLSHELITNTYDPNDMGFLPKNNFINNEIRISYNIYDPFWRMMEWQNSFTINYTSLYTPGKYADFGMELQSISTFRNYLFVMLNAYYRPIDEHDYYEPRVDGWYYAIPPVYSFTIFLSPDYRKRFITDVRASYYVATEDHERGYSASLEPRLRFNDKFFVTMEIAIAKDNNNKGYVTDSISATGNEVIIFGRRDITTITNAISARYIFTSTSSLLFRLRHYWIWGEYDRYYDLQKDGHLLINDFTVDEDFAFNAFTIDMSYIWQFAPGSELSVVWKNAINTSESAEITHAYFENLSNTLSSPATNSFSVKILYYIDYQNIRKKNRR
ncbi:MAG: DUF5916 domain-containing protein [Bacteroidetes bacterium]|nr:DUF5916 domain-containing protein [Bacteroidota bacterium]